MKTEEPKKKATRLKEERAPKSTAKPKPAKATALGIKPKPKWTPEPAKKPVKKVRAPHRHAPGLTVFEPEPLDEVFDEPAVVQPHEPFDLESELIADDLTIVDEELLVGEPLELDALDIPIALIDPVIVETPHVNAPLKPHIKPPVKIERRPQQCVGCGGTFTWVSVDGLCFSCLKKRVAQKRREDESYSGFTAETEEEDDGS